MVQAAAKEIEENEIFSKDRKDLFPQPLSQSLDSSKSNTFINLKKKDSIAMQKDVS